MAPLRPCKAPGCPRLAADGWCAAHVGERHRRFDRERPGTAARGYGGAHRRWRAAVLARDPICRACGAAPATVADHVTPLSAGGGWELANGQGLCRACHNGKTARERAARGRG